MIPENFEIRQVYVGKCDRCGGSIPRADWNFCPYCGFSLKGNVAATEYKETEDADDAYRRGLYHQ